MVSSVLLSAPSLGMIGSNKLYCCTHICVTRKVWRSVFISSHLEGEVEEVGNFDGGKDGTCSREMTPKTCPMVTLNWEALEGLAQDYRYTRFITAIYI